MRHALLFLLLLPLVAFGQTAETSDAREMVIAVATSQIGTQEKTGHNDGGAIDRILASVGLEGTGAPYCAAFNRWCYDNAGLHDIAPRSALASAWVRNPTWTRANGGSTPLPADTWGIYFSSKKRVAHTGIVEKWGNQIVVTIEANTSPDAVAGSEADRNGDGVWRKRRLIKQIYAARNWID